MTGLFQHSQALSSSQAATPATLTQSLSSTMPPLPVPAQLMTQLDKCKTVRNGEESYKSRVKTPEEMKASQSSLPPLPVPAKP